jgi:catechol 2,3-dioxygenase-like lactoylglutathione lyase family enzyme
MKRYFISAAFLAAGVLIGISTLTPRLAARNSGPAQSNAPVLINTCLITSDVNRLAAFYSQVLGIEPRKDGDSYVEFRTPRGVLAMFASDAQEKYIPGSARPGENRSAIIEFEVSDVDKEYARLHDVVKNWVKGPTTQPWGTRSIYFRDPDGNLVNFFTIVPNSQPSPRNG